MSWPVSFDDTRISLHTKDRISEVDAKRQTATAKEILRRLSDQPGLVLADEVGMGKTFVALAVAASAAWADRNRNPVVVMVPPSLREKWPRDFEVFRELCLRRTEDRGERGLSHASANNGAEFLRLLDDPVSQRKQVIFLTHGALYRSLGDPWSRLAILRAALRTRRLADRRRAFPRFAAEIVRFQARFSSEEGIAALLESEPREWRKVLSRFGHDEVDDPVPLSLCRVLENPNAEVAREIEDLREVLRELPIRDSANRADRVASVRKEIALTMRSLWHAALVQARFRSPLLILDEAHHLKNPETGLASLFVIDEAAEEASLLQGALKNRFERMLFLTATPFQLGHRELLNVLDRFRGIRWESGSPTILPEGFDEVLERLGKRLDDAQRAAVRLDRRWADLRAGDVEGWPEDPESLERWWRSVLVRSEDVPERVQRVLAHFRSAGFTMKEAEGELRPWVLRHHRPKCLPGSHEGRRKVLAGAAILGLENREGSGLAVDGPSLLPFLLVARSQAVAFGPVAGRLGAQVRQTTFAEGLASSFEAYRDTRKRPRSGESLAHVVDEALVDLRDPEGDAPLLLRYLRRLDKTLPKLMTGHPKVEATVRRAVALWEAGEKVLVFCHYRATGEALTRHISKAVREKVLGRAALELGCSRHRAEIQLARLGDSFEPGRPAFRVLETAVKGMLAAHEELGEEEKAQVFRVVRRFVRTQSFLVRYFPLAEGDAGERTEQALDRRDESGLSLRDKVESFVRFIAKRCLPEEREAFLSALDKVQTGTREEPHDSDESGAAAVNWLPIVRLANGETDPETRSRLLLTFNTPFFPEILVASSVLAEGVDLHLNCRYIIHHDLCWNPSTLEQRTGRVDRIGAKAEVTGKPIHVFLPYVGGTQDEKMYRVVRDRERWFQVVMGEKFALDELATESMAERVPLPESAARGLALSLEVWRGEDDVV